MSVLRRSVSVAAPASVVFDHARSVSLHVRSLAPFGEQVVDAPGWDLLGPGDEVTWRGRHFGRTWELTSRITRFDRPEYFQDTMVRGPFASLVHDHYFKARGETTEATDVFAYTVGFGLLGAIADRAFVRRRLKRILEARGEAIKEASEGSRRPPPAPPAAPGSVADGVDGERDDAAALDVGDEDRLRGAS